MEYKKLILPAALFALLIILLVLFFASQGKEKTPEVTSDETMETGISGEKEVETKKMVLFFISEEDNLLRKEEREIVLGSTLEHQIECLVEELLLGSEQGLISPLPLETKIRGIYITRNRIAYIDFSSEFQTSHPSGSSAEISSIFSVVNSITYNFKSIEKVFILINGTEQETLAGHIDLRKPFLPRYDLIMD
ncbi:MAG: GerMN domain-containing protein [Candidatus Aminicenantes bacterium]